MTDVERRLLSRILPHSGVIVCAQTERQETGGTVAEFAAANRPKMSVHFVPPDESLSVFARARGIRRIHLLHLGPRGENIQLMRSAADMIRAGRIDILRFDYRDGLKRGESIGDVISFLVPFGFTIMRVNEGGATLLSAPDVQSESWTKNAYFALAARLSPLVARKPGAPTGGESIIDISAHFSKSALQPRGVIHVGAHHGEELPLYKRMGFRPILFVEANPDLAEALRRATAGDPDVIVANCAISDADGQTTLHVTSNDMSSSILPLKMHRQYYPAIDEIRQVAVPARRIDTLLEELRLPATRFNFLHLDIQGAELQALNGAAKTLPHMDALVTEVNFEELYEGCGLFDDLDDHLTGRGFVSQTVACPCHPSWGDAFYLRPRPPVPSPSDPISMYTLGRNGRFGNQLFQYAFLAILARHHNLEIWTPPWVGQELFGIHSSQVYARFPRIFESRQFPEALFPRALFEDRSRVARRDFWGYMQFDTVHYAPYKDFIRSLYRPLPHIEKPLREAMRRITREGRRPLVAIHIRRGDFAFKQFFASPTGWYRGLLDLIWPHLDNPILYICSDELPKVLPDFSDYSPITQKELGVVCQGAEFYTDFYVMSQADVLTISNSSYSFFASLLNERSHNFFRPHLYEQRLVPYDPWNAPPIFHRELGKPLSGVLNRLEKKYQSAFRADISESSTLGVQVLGKTPGGSTIITFKPGSDNPAPHS